MASSSLFFNHLPPLPLLLLVQILLCSTLATSEPPLEEKQALLTFINNVPHSKRLVWNSTVSPCNWVGVQCDLNRTHVVSLRLPAAGLVGAIPPSTIGRLSGLRVLSLRSNGLSGGLPPDIANLTSLHSLYLQSNTFSGELPGQLAGLVRLTRLDLSSNGFVGEVPAAINNLTSLTGLFLENNSFNGVLPNISIGSLTSFDVSNNNLSGAIPAPLRRFPASSFAGNIQLCGRPLSPCRSPPPPPRRPPPPPRPPPKRPPPSSPPPETSIKVSRTAIIIISAATGGTLLLLSLLAVLCCLVLRRRRRLSAGAGETSGEVGRTAATAKEDTGSSGTVSGEQRINGGDTKLVFVDGGARTFDLEDMLRASAEVLGKGSTGTTYRAALEDEAVVAVKRLREVAVGRREFAAQMETLGKISHDNVVAVRAFYFSKDEKLIVSDYYSDGSLSALLHGSKGGDRAKLDWDSRLRIAVAAGRGIAHLHTAARIPHGNIKASNVLLHSASAAGVSDYGLNAILSRAALANRTGAGYRPPEAKVTLKSDVYSFGVVLLELMTGRAATSAGKGADLPAWVESVVKEAWTEDVFDEEMVKGRRREGEKEEMMELLQVAMACVAEAADDRPDMEEVVRRMEEVGQAAAAGGERPEKAAS